MDGWLGSIFSGAVFVGLLNLLHLEPQKQSITQYNETIKGIGAIIDSCQQKSIEYWAKSGVDIGLEAQIVGFKTDCYSSLQILNKKSYKHFDYGNLLFMVQEYFQTITGGDFQTEIRQPSRDVLQEATSKSRDLKFALENAKIPFTRKNLLFMRLK